MRAILFDFGGTLDFPRHWLDRFLAHYRKYGVNIERPEFDHAFTTATEKAYASSAMLRDYNLSQLVGFLIQLQLQDLASGEMALGRQLLKALAAEDVGHLRTLVRDSFVAESVAGFAVARPLLASLARRFKIAVVSNFYGNLHRVVADAGLAQAVRVTADSSVLGFYKPDPRIFAAALAQLGVQPHDAVMVGDSINKDCAPARKIGMRTVWLRHRELSGPAAPTDLTDFTIDCLEELKDFAWLAG
jgi:HAD superfamily hydrolase (TIGR01509 family)